MISRSLILLILLNVSTAFGFGFGSGRTADEAEVVQYLSQQVYEMKKQYLVWHWFKNTGRNPVWQSALPSNSREGENYMVGFARRYWQSFCSLTNPSANPRDCGNLNVLKFGATNMYGAALYTSVDPVATFTFGGGPNEWVLMQIQVPKGFRVIDLAKDSSPLPKEIKNFFNQAQCPTATTVDELFRMGQYNINSGSNQYEACAATVRRIFKDTLKIDGFFYTYASSNFRGCNTRGVSRSAETDALGGYQGPFGGRAFVITSPDKIAAKDIKVFNQHTPDAKADRSMIASAMYSVHGGQSYAAHIAWTDISAQQIDPGFSSWLQENLIGCKEEVPYGPAGGI